MKKSPLALLTLFVVFALRAHAIGIEIDLDLALSQLQANGAVPFSNQLYQDQANARKLAERLGPLLEGAGEFYTYEIVSRRFLAKRIERVVIVLYLEKYPIYLRVDLYMTAKGRICLPALVSKEASDVLPFDLISVAGK